MPYRDNVHSISLSRTAADEGLQRIQEDLLAMGCIPYEEVEATGYFQTLGGIVDGEAGQIKPTPTRAWNVLLAFKDCFVSKVGWRFMQRLLEERQRVVHLDSGFTHEAGDLAHRSGLSPLERRSVSKVVENQYAMHYKKVKSLCRDAGMDRLVDKEKPPESRVPMPKLIVYGLAMLMLNKGKKDVALKAMLDFDTYIGPGGSINLLNKHPVRGAGPQYKWYSVIVRDFHEKRPDKVGVFDNTIALNTPERLWLGEALATMMKGKKNTVKIFAFTMEEFRKTFSEMSKKVGILQLHPYHLRHEGATRTQAASRGTRLQ